MFTFIQYITIYVYIYPVQYFMFKYNNIKFLYYIMIMLTTFLNILLVSEGIYIYDCHDQ